MTEQPRLVCVGRITGAHGIKGMVKIFSHAQNSDTLTKLGPLFDSHGKRRFVLTKISPQGKLLLASVEGVTDRNAAEALSNTDLYLPREKLPRLEDGKFYYADLIGLEARDMNGQKMGRIAALHNYGAGDIIEIKPDSSESFLVSFNADTVKKVSAADGYITIDRPDETE